MADAALEDQQQMEVEIPEGLDLIVVDPAETAAATDKTKAAAAAPTETTDRGDLGAALKEERGKRKQLAEEWRRAKAETDALRERMRSNLDTDTPNGALGRARETAKQSAERLRGIGAQIRTKGPQVTDLGQFADQVGSAVEAAAAEIVATNEASAKAIEAAEQRAAALVLKERTRSQEQAMRERYPDWEQALADAGIFDAVQMIPDGKGGQVFRNPALAEMIYQSPNPARRAYELALGKQEADAEERGETVPTDRSLTDRRGVREADPVPARRPETRPVLTDEQEAERRGAGRVIDQVTANATRQRGLRAVPATAGGTQTRVLDRPYLDRLADSNPAAYERLMEANPNLKQWHLGGI